MKQGAAIVSVVVLSACAVQDNPTFLATESAGTFAGGSTSTSGSHGTTGPQAGTTSTSSSSSTSGRTTGTTSTTGDPPPVDLPPPMTWPPSPICEGVELDELGSSCDPFAENMCPEGQICRLFTQSLDLRIGCANDNANGVPLDYGAFCEDASRCGPLQACFTPNAFDTCAADDTPDDDTPDDEPPELFDGCCTQLCNLDENNCAEGLVCRPVFRGALDAPHPCLERLGFCNVR